MSSLSVIQTFVTLYSSKPHIWLCYFAPHEDTVKSFWPRSHMRGQKVSRESMIFKKVEWGEENAYLYPLLSFKGVSVWAQYTGYVQGNFHSKVICPKTHENNTRSRWQSCILETSVSPILIGNCHLTMCFDHCVFSAESTNISTSEIYILKSDNGKLCFVPDKSNVSWFFMLKLNTISCLSQDFHQIFTHYLSRKTQSCWMALTNTNHCASIWDRETSQVYRLAHIRC